LDPKVNKKYSQNIRYDVAGFFIPCLEIDMQYHHNFHTITNISGHYLMELSQSNHTSHLLPLTHMSRRLKSVETTLRVTCEWPHVMNISKEINHGNQNVFWVLRWVGGYLYFIPSQRRGIKFTNIRQPMLKLKTHSGFHELFRFWYV
jgi:hypothetical protein